MSDIVVGVSPYGNVYKDAKGCYFYDPTDPSGVLQIPYPCPYDNIQKQVTTSTKIKIGNTELSIGAVIVGAIIIGMLVKGK